VVQAAPPLPYTTQNQGSMAGLDYQLQLTQYDSAGRDYRTIDNLGRVNETQYDDAGRVVKTIQNYANGRVWGAAYRTTGNMATLQLGKMAKYEVWNRQVKVLDRSTVIQRNAYDGANRRIQVYDDFDAGTSARRTRWRGTATCARGGLRVYQKA
jgi:hypothetical protein